MMTQIGASEVISAEQATVLKTETEKCYFTLFVGDETFGLPVDEAQTIFIVTHLTKIPLSRPDILGFINLRGKVVTAVCLRQRLGLPPLETTLGAMAIAVDQGAHSFALIVDGIGDVLSLPVAARIAIPPHLDAKRARCTAELYCLNAALIPILDTNVLFDFNI